MMTESSPLSSSYRTAEDSFAENSPESSGDSLTRVSTGRTILLLGAPRASSLRDLPLINFSDNNGNNSKLLPAFPDQTSGNVDHVTSTPLPVPTATEPPAAWRILPLKRKYLHTGFSQRPDVHTPVHIQLEAASMSYNSAASPAATNATTSSTDGDEDEDEDEDLSRSFAAHNIPSSTVAGPSDLEVSFTSTTTTSSLSSLEAPPSSLQNIHLTALTNLRNIPTASYLRSIVPQTMSISAIVGIIQIRERRTFAAKRYSTPLTVQTLLVGDETSAGFKLDLWLPNGKLTAASNKFIATVDSLRVGDVILVRNMALGFWNNQVNGATLRKDRTRIELIYRVNCFGKKERRRWRAVELEDTGEGGAEKVKRVVDWVRDFVGGDDKPKKRKVKEGSNEVYEKEQTQLPEDTQESI